MESHRPHRPSKSSIWSPTDLPQTLQSSTTDPTDLQKDYLLSIWSPTDPTDLPKLAYFRYDVLYPLYLELTLFLLAKGRINPYSVITWDRPVGKGLRALFNNFSSSQTFRDDEKYYRICVLWMIQKTVVSRSMFSVMLNPSASSKFGLTILKFFMDAQFFMYTQNHFGTLKS